jgi:hypothetical protein
MVLLTTPNHAFGLEIMVSHGFSKIGIDATGAYESSRCIFHRH